MNVNATLGILSLLWIGSCLAATGQTSTPPAEISRAYDCSAHGFAKGKLIFLPGGRWMKGAQFDAAASALEPQVVGSKRRLFVDGTIRRRMSFFRWGPGLRGRFRVEGDRVVLFYPGVTHAALQSFFNDNEPDPLQFRIDPASGNLIEVPFGSFRRLMTCTRDGFF